MATKILALLVALLLSACGGGDASPDDEGFSCIGGVLYDPSGVPASGADGKVLGC